MAASPFTKKTLAFLRALKRNNNREWFRARKADYEEHVRDPMVALLGQLARDLPAFAPDLVSDPRVSLFRIYRDTRFSHDKRPLKTQIAAHFPSRKFPKGEGAEGGRRHHAVELAVIVRDGVTNRAQLRR